MKLMDILSPNPRPYWHVDAKWVFGILLFFALITTLLLSTLIKLTDENNGPKLAAIAIGSLFIREDTIENEEAIRAEIRKQGGAIRPIPFMPKVVITEADLELSLNDIKIKVFQPLTTEMYQNGIEATAAKYAPDEESRKKFINDAFAFRILTKKSHEALVSQFNMLVIVCLVLLAGFIYFSAGWGRLANPGLLLLAVSLPGSLLALLVANPPKDGDGGPLAFLPPALAQEFGLILGQTYQPVAIWGLVLLAAALIGKIVTSVIAKSKPKKTGKA